MRFGRVVIPGCPHHIIQRGNRKAKIFLDDSDRLVYLRLLRDACDLYRTLIWTYTLMGNHVHIVGVPERKDSLAKTIKDAHGEYSSYFNTKYGLVGHAWQGRFKSAAMDENHCRNAIRYVELNPVRAGLVVKAEDYLWSGAAGHCGLRDDPLLSQECPLIAEITDWSQWLRIENPIEIDNAIRLHTRTGRPLGSVEFLAKLEGITGRKLLPQKRGPRYRQPSHDSPEKPALPLPDDLFG